MSIRDVLGVMVTDRSRIKTNKRITVDDWYNAMDEIDALATTPKGPVTGGVADDDPRLSDARTPLKHEHTPGDMKDMGVITIAWDDPRLSDAREPTNHEHEPEDIIGGVLSGTDPRLTDARTPVSHSHAATDVTGTAVVDADTRLTDARTPTTHTHAPGDTTGTAVVTNDARLSDARTPNSHVHSPSDVTGTAVVTNDARLADARTPLTHTHEYEPANANIQSHVTASHAPVTAQANADITKEEIEAKLTGAISTHTHSGGSDPFLVKLRLAGDITNATVTPTNLTNMVFSYEANSFYVFEMFMLCTSGATTTGYAFAVDVSSAVTSVGLHFTHQLATGGTVSGGDSIADNTARGLSSGVPAITVINPVMGHGILLTGANAGTAQFMFRPEVAFTATCKAGSVIRVMKIS